LRGRTLAFNFERWRIEGAQRVVMHSNTKTTRLYDRRIGHIKRRGVGKSSGLGIEFFDYITISFTYGLS